MIESILKDEKTTYAFIRQVIPSLQNDEVLVAMLAARKKYEPTLARSQEVLKRKIIRENDAEKITNKLRELSLINFYSDQNIQIPKKAFVAYIDLNPKSILKAFTQFNCEINKLIYEGAVTQHMDYHTLRRIDLKLFSAIHRSNARHIYWCLDIDRKDRTALDRLISFLGKHNIQWCSETHNGFHLIVKRNNETGMLLFKEGIPPTLKPFIEIKKEPMTPVPGTLQGGFLVKPVPLTEAKQK